VRWSSANTASKPASFHRPRTGVWYHTYGMHKTTVYLNDEEVEALRLLSASTGRSQADLIREAIRHATRTASAARTFRSLGKGQGPGGPTPRWAAAELFDKRLPAQQ
jgi:Ribbon-helix-helix protein, copG family